MALGKRMKLEWLHKSWGSYVNIDSTEAQLQLLGHLTDVPSALSNIEQIRFATHISPAPPSSTMFDSIFYRCHVNQHSPVKQNQSNVYIGNELAPLGSSVFLLKFLWFLCCSLCVLSQEKQKQKQKNSDLMKHSHITEGNPCYSVSWFKYLPHSKNICPMTFRPVCN